MPKLWKLYSCTCTPRYRIGRIVKFLWWEWIDWYMTHTIQNPIYHTETRYGRPVEFETIHLDYAKQELKRLNDLEISIAAEDVRRKPKSIWVEVKDA